jgi:serine/threonine-protein kinase
MRPRPADSGAPTPTEVTTVDLSGSCVGTSYLLIEEIGGGATGRVWRAVDRGSGDQVAIKLLRRELLSEPKAVTRFVQERSILLMLRHRRIVRVRDLLTISDSLGLVMDLVNGGTLRDHLRERGTLAPAVAAELLAQVAEALAEAHRLGVVHRDLKPDNVLLDGADPAEPQVRLTDFGIARLLDSPGMTTPQALVGTPNYLAPEVITGGDPSPAVDVYALGVLLYELLLGRPPYAGGPPVVVLRRHLECTPRRYAGVPDEAWRTVLACMARDPARRPTAEALVTTMRSLARRASVEPAAPAADDIPPEEPSGGEPAGSAAAASGDQVEPGYAGNGRPGDGRTPASPVRTEQPHRPSPGPTIRPTGRRPRRRRQVALAFAGGVVLAAMAVVGAATGGLPHWLDTALGHRPPMASGPMPAVPGPAQASPGAAASPTGTTPSTGPTGSADAPGSRLSGPEAGRQHGRTAPPLRVTAKVYGPLRCTSEYQWDVGHPVVAQPCHATGPGIELYGRLQALPGVQADVSLTLQDVATGRTVAGPFTCHGLMFTDFAREHACGPFQTTGVTHGRRYAVVQRWSYTGRGMLPAGSARSEPFRW